MRRPSWYRAVIGIWAFWFAAVSLDAPGLHTCAIHSHATAYSNSDGGSAHAGHEMRAGHPRELAKHDGSSHQTPAGCSCLGTCCCATPVVALSRRIDLPAPVVVATAKVAFVVASSASAPREHAHPFAHGPPAA